METIASGIVLETDSNHDRKFVEQCPLDNLERLRFMIGDLSHSPKTIEEWSRKYFIPVNEMTKRYQLMK